MCLASAQDCQVGAVLPEWTGLDEAGLFLDLENPARCGGKAKGWKMCYYGQINQLPTLAVDLLLYRQYNVPERQTTAYALVSLKRVVSNATEVMPSGFHCVTVDLKETEMFDVYVGDMMGACLQTNEDLQALRVLGSMPVDLDITKALHKSTAIQGSCFIEDIAFVVQTELLPLTGSLLHLSIVTDDEGKLYTQYTHLYSQIEWI